MRLVSTMNSKASQTDSRCSIDGRIAEAESPETRETRGCHKRINPVEFEIVDEVLLWSMELSEAEKKEVVKPWTGTYKVKERSGRVGYVIESDVGEGAV